MKYLTIPPKYILTKEMSRSLAGIEANKAVIESIDIPLELEQNIRRQSILGSALFSARIEGNALTSADVQSVEIANLYQVIEKIGGQNYKKKKTITLSEILGWHRQAMKHILGNGHLGKIRTEHEGLFDIAGNVYYHAPPPQAVKNLLEELLKYSNSSREQIVPVKAAISHLVFEKIHPFADGNGRVGRLLQQAILTKSYGMRGLTSVEEDIDKNRQEYYLAIEGSVGGKCQGFIELMLTFIYDASKRAMDNLRLKAKSSTALDLLLPRRKEIVQIISDHQMVSFDFLKRRFLKISPRQLAYDLQALCESGYIRKIGKTRGALYTVKN